MSYSVIEGRTVSEFVQKMNGAFYGSKNLVGGANVDTLTLDFSTPAVTVTFSGTDPLSVEEIVNQINTQAGSDIAKVLIVRQGTVANRYPKADKRVMLFDATSGVVLDGTGTANAELGFPGGGQSGSPVDSTKIVVSGQNAEGWYAVIAP